MNTMLEQINSAGLRFVEFAFPVLAQSSVLIVILLLADFLLRKRVRAVFRYWLWMLVLLKLILPSSLSLPVSVGYWFGDELANVKVSDLAVSVNPADMPQATESAPVEVGIEAPAATPREAVEPAVSETVSSEAVSAAVTWQGVVFLVWLAVVAVMALLLLQRAIFVIGLVAQAGDADSSMNDAFEYCRGRMRIKGKVGLKVSANATSPAVCGLFRPVVLLPENLGPKLESNQLRAVLLHEFAHIKRGDLWVNLAQTLLQIVYFYNPLLWLANAVIRRVREQAVDEMVQVAMGASARQYPQTLVDVAKLAFKRPALSLRLIGVVESKSALKGRIKRMLNRPIPKSAKLGVVGLLAVVIAGAVLLPMAKATAARPEFVISGTVTDAETGQPIAGAKVGDVDRYAKGRQWTTTNSDGKYSYHTWYEEHSIKAEAAGYKTQHKGLYTKLFGSEKEKVIDFALESNRNVEEVDYSSVVVEEGFGFGDIIVGCTGDFIKSKLGKPDKEVKNEEDWWLNYRKTCGLGFWVNPKENVLKEIRLNKGFKGQLTSGISMSSSKQDVFKTYGKPVSVETVDNLTEHFDDQVLYETEGGFFKPKNGKIFYRKNGLLFWFEGDKTLQIVIHPKKVKTDVQVEDMKERIARGPEQVQAIDKMLREWFGACVAGDGESMKKAYSTSYQLVERDLREMNQLLGMNPSWQFSLLAVMWDEEKAMAVSGALEHGDPKVGGPMVLVWTFNNSEDKWGIIDIDLEELEGLQIENSRFMQKHPNAQVWFDNPDLNAPKMRQNPDVQIEVEKPDVQVEGEGEQKNIIQGVVHNESGKPVVGALVLPLPHGGHPVKTDSTGEFEIVGPSENRRIEMLLARDVNNNLAAAAELGDYKEPLDITLTPAVTITGRLTDPNGMPIAGARASPSVHTEEWGARFGFTVFQPTDSNGIYEIKALAVGQDYGIGVGGIEGYGGNSVRLGILDRPGLQQMENIILEPANLSVTGIVLDDKDNPMAGINVQASGKIQRTKKVKTDSTGRFKIDGICKGRVELYAWNADHLWSGTEDANGGDQDIEIFMRKGRQTCMIPPKNPPVSLVGKPIPSLETLGIHLPERDINGKQILVCFWKLMHDESRECIRQLVARTEELAKKNTVIVAAQIWPRNEKQFRRWLEKNNVKFPVSILPDPGEQKPEERVTYHWGLQNRVPWLILTDDQHVVRAEGFSIDDLDEKIHLSEKPTVEVEGGSEQVDGKGVGGEGRSDAAVYERLKKTADVSELTAEMAFGEALEVLKGSVEPPLQIIVLWRDLEENADINRNTPINMEGVSGIRLGTALKLLLKSVSGGFAELGYVVDGGAIVIATKESLPRRMETRVYDTSDVLSRPADYYAQPRER